MDLHYSQTDLQAAALPLAFHYLMDLHYSQTADGLGVRVVFVSLPYGFTLFSNAFTMLVTEGSVSLPYGFTLFSNVSDRLIHRPPVSLPYGFTLFSNLK